MREMTASKRRRQMFGVVFGFPRRECPPWRRSGEEICVTSLGIFKSTYSNFPNSEKVGFQI